MLSSIEVLARSITYKPNVRIELVKDVDIYKHYEAMLILHVFSRVPDAMDQKRGGLVEMVFRQYRPYESFSDDSDVYQWVGHCLMEMEAHERDEWYRVNGKMVRNPHPEMKQQPQGERYGRGSNL